VGQRVRVGIIGLGEVAQVVHLPVLETLSDRFEVGAVCDVSPGLVDLIGERYGVPKASRYGEAADLATQADLDAVLVLSSDEYHADHAVAALSNGKHVLVEKPVCLSISDAERIVAARDAAGVQVMVGYMRRFAPAFVEAVGALERLGPIKYARVRDIIGQNRLIIEQTSTVHRFDDIPAAASEDRAARARTQVAEAIGAESPGELVSAYRLLCGLGSHDISAMRELLGTPRRVLTATQWEGGRFLSVLFGYPGYGVGFEMGVDRQRRFDASIEVFGESASFLIQYDTPYVRHLPTTLNWRETKGDAYEERTLRPTLSDPYTEEWKAFCEVVTANAAPKTTPEDAILDLRLFREIVDVLRDAASPAALA
jgi:predicted dehydrogenase